MSPVLKRPSPALIFGAPFAIGVLLLVGVELVMVFSNGNSEDQRASQAVDMGFSSQEHCHAYDSAMPGGTTFCVDQTG